MTFEVGKKYRDSKGRKWRIIKEFADGDMTHVVPMRVFDVRRVWFPSRCRMAFEEPNGKTAIVLLGMLRFTRIYAEE